VGKSKTPTCSARAASPGWPPTAIGPSRAPHGV